MAEQARRCTAKSKSTGDRCRRPPIRGGTVCYQHGGAAPQVKRKAEERLRELQDPAVNRLEDLLNLGTRVVIDTPEGPKTIALIKGSPGVVLSAAKTVLDRTGLSEGHKLEHTGKDGGPIRTVSTDLDLSVLSDKELKLLAKLHRKIEGDREGAAEA